MCRLELPFVDKKALFESYVLHHKSVNLTNTFCRLFLYLFELPDWRSLIYRIFILHSDFSIWLLTWLLVFFSLVNMRLYFFLLCLTFIILWFSLENSPSMINWRKEKKTVKCQSLYLCYQCFLIFLLSFSLFRLWSMICLSHSKVLQSIKPWLEITNLFLPPVQHLKFHAKLTSFSSINFFFYYYSRYKTAM